MTINSETRVAGPFDGNDSTVSFPFTFKVFDSDEVRVVAETGAVETDLELGTDYAVTLNADQNAAPGGSVVLAAPLATGTRLTLTSALEMLQPVDLTNQGGFYPRVINSALDRLTILLQQLASVVSRTLKFPLSDGPVGDLPGRSVRAGTVLAFDEATGEPVAGPDISSVNGVAGALVAINTVAVNIADVNTVATNIADVNAVGQNIADVNTVADNIAGVNTVADNIADVNTVADNITDLSNFSRVYYGPSATDPTTRRDGSPLQVGDLYFSTVTYAMRAYNGSAWSDSVSGAVTVQNLSGDGVQTQFPLNYAPESEVLTSVFISGVYQQKNTYALGGANGDVLIFNAAPPAGANNIEVVVSSLVPSDDKLRQELASSSGAGLIQHSTSDPDSTQETIASLLDARPSVLNFGAVGDGVAVDDVAIQKMATACDLRQMRYVYIPNWGATYKITAPISIKYPGVRVFGDQGGTYNRGLGKLGWLEGASGLTRFFDLGASRTEGNPADHWQVDGLSFKQETAATARTIDGVSFTMRQNGPDRGAKIRDCSFIGLKDAITVENPDIATVLGTLDVGGCVFQGCDSAINAKGMIFGLRFVGNQCEQNRGASGAGVIRGSINGPVTIADNMLEGQPNVISIDIPGITGNRPHLQSRGNYFEANSGDYVHRFRTSTAQASITIGPNYTQSITATDYVLIEESAGSMYMDVYDDFPVTFKNAPTTLKYGSNILRNRQRAYKVRQVSVTKPTEVVISDFAGLTDVAADHVHVSYEGVSAATLEDTPLGRRYCLNGTTFTTIPLSVAAGDLVAINLLCRAEEVVPGNLVPQVWDAGTTVILREWGSSGIATELAGKWALVSIAFVVSAASSSIRFRFTAPSGTYSTLLAGISAKNQGAFLNNGITGSIITPVTPRLPNPAPYLEGAATYDPPSLADGAAVQTTVGVVGAAVGDFASATFSNSLQGVIISAYVTAAGTVAVRFQNETGAAVDLASGTLRVRVQR